MKINEQIQPENVDNPIDYLPSVNTDEMVSIMRIDKTIGNQRIKEYILNAYDTLNPKLPNHFLSPSFLLNKNAVDRDFWERTYKRAIMHEAAAQFIDKHPDYDSTASGTVRGENETTKSGALRRIYNHCVADLTGKPRNRVRLL